MKGLKAQQSYPFVLTAGSKTKNQWHLKVTFYLKFHTVIMADLF